MSDFFSTFLFFLPAFVGNSAPVLIRHFPGLQRWNAPLSEKFLGKNKTWRGLIFAIVTGSATGFALFAFIPQFLPISLSVEMGGCLGALLGFGAIAGDAIESFIKRKVGKNPGEPLPFWDGVDYILGALLVASPFFIPNFWSIVALLFLAPTLSLLANITSYLCGWKEVWH